MTREKEIKSRELETALQRESIDSLKGYSGIGPGTIDKLKLHGFASLRDLNTRSINIQGLGEKRIGDIRFALDSIYTTLKRNLVDPTTELGRNVARQISEVHRDSAAREATITSQIKIGSDVQREFLKIEAISNDATFIAYLTKSSDAVIPEHVLRAPLPDVNAIFAKSISCGDASKAPVENAGGVAAQHIARVVNPIHSQRANEAQSTRTELGNGAPIFIGPGQSISVAGYLLSDPLIYIADCAVSSFDASVLCLRRRIDPPRAEPSNALGYWPQLSALQPFQVGNYLHWLSNGRSDPAMDVGYVFLFFYGLERRAIVDNQDTVSIAYESARLLSVYHQNRSFRSYATGFLCYLIMLRRIRPAVKLIDKLLEYQDRYIDEGLWTTILGNLAIHNEPLPATWAQRIAAQDERAKQSVFIERHPDEFGEIFSAHYSSRFGAGLIPCSAGQVTLNYRAASPSLLQGTAAHKRIAQVSWPQIQSWRGQCVPIVAVWNESLDALKVAVRRKNADSSSISKGEQLGVDPASQDRWSELLSAQSTSDIGCLLIPVSNLAAFAGIGPRSRLTLAQSKSLATLAESLGTPLEPDARYTGKSYPWDAHIAVLRLSEMPVLPQGKSYAVAGVIARLALEISEADGETTQDERQNHIIISRRAVPAGAK